MKKVYKSLIAMVFIVLVACSSANAQITYIQDFETGLNGWSTNWGNTTTDACVGQSPRRNIYTNGTAGAFVSPNLGPNTGGPQALSFDYKIINWSGGGATPATFGTIQVQYATAVSGPWTTVHVIDQTNHIPSTSCATITSPEFCATVGDFFIRFNCTYSTGDYYVYFDNISLSPGAPQCFAPSALNASMVDNANATFVWSAGCSETNWNFELGAVGFAPGTGNAIYTSNVSSVTETVSGLNQVTNYEAYVQADCGGGEFSTWVGPISILTLPNCASPTAIIPSVVNPETVDLVWSAGAGGETEWVVEYGANGFTLGTGTQVVVLTNPTIQITGLTENTAYSFYVRGVCSVPDSSLWIGPSSITTPLWCPNPSGLGATVVAGDANLTWTPGSGAETEWNIEYGPIGFTLGTGTTYTTTNNNPDVLSGLAGSIIYQYYVQASCSNGYTSLFVGPASFTMPIVNDEACDAILLPADGQNRYFHNQGATASESGIIIIPSVDCYDNTGWCINTGITNSVWFKIVAPTSGNVIVSSTATTLDGQLALFSAVNCADYSTFELIAANDDADEDNLAPELSACGLIPGNTYYVMYDPWSAGANHNFAIRVEEVNVTAGIDGSTVVCSTEDALELNEVISGQDAGGTWLFNINPFALDGSLFDATILPTNTYTLLYTVQNGCARDTALALVTIVNPASAGIPVSPFNACNTGPVFLFAGLEGTITTGGDWSDNMATGLLQGSVFQANGIPAGVYEFTYTVDNGVCPPASSLVSVNLNNCTGIEETEVAFSVYPNPTNGQFFITSTFNGEVTIQVLDVTGKLVYAENTQLNAQSMIEVNVAGVANGMYIVRMQSENNVSTQSIVIK
jgi:hypothetical protein